MSDESKSFNPADSPAPKAPQREQPETLEKILQEKAPEVLSAIPGEKRAVLSQVTIERSEIRMRSGPLPEPAELDAYNRIIPNGADRILKMAEAQSAHRIEIEKVVITSQQRQSFCGQLFGLLIGLSGLSLATYAAVTGQPWFGSIIGGATLVSLVSAFLYTQTSQKRELEQKHEQTRPAEQVPSQNKKKQNRNR